MVGIRSWGLLVFVALAALTACDSAGSGQTGSPFADPPEYRSPQQQNPGGTGGTSGGGSEPVNNDPRYRRSGGDFSVLSGGHLVVMGPSGLLVYDLSDASTPRQVGSLDVEGYALQLIGDDDGVTLVALESTHYASDQVPTAPVPSQAQRLIRVDLSDPTTPKRVAQIDLSYDFWDLRQDGARYYVLADEAVSPPAACSTSGTDPGLGGGAVSQTKHVTSYVLGSNGFEQVDDAVLPGDGYAKLGDQDFVSVSNSTAQRQTLNWRSYLTSGTPAVSITLPGQMIGLDARGGQIGVVTSDDAGAVFQLYDASNPSALTLMGSTPIPFGGAQPLLFPDGRVAVLTGDPAVVVDLRVPAAPVVASTLPNDVEVAVATSAGVLGLGPKAGAPNGNLVVSIWDLSVASSPGLLGRVETGWHYSSPFANGPWPLEVVPWVIDASSSSLLFPYQTVPELAPRLGVFSFGGREASIARDQAVTLSDVHPLRYLDAVYLRDQQSLEAASLTDAATTHVIPLAQPSLLDQAQVNGYTASLLRRPDGVSVVTVAPASGDPLSFELEHQADELIVNDDALVAAGLNWNTECDYMIGADPSGDAASGAKGACSPSQRRGLTVLTTAGGPKVSKVIPIESGLDVTLPSDAQATTQWQGYLQLPNDLLAFPVQRHTSCWTVAACDQLGIEPSEVMTAPGCSSTSDCSNQGPQTQISGARTDQLVYLLDLHDPAQAKLGTPLTADGEFDLPGEGPLDVAPRAFVSDTELDFEGYDYVYDAHGNSVDDQYGQPLVEFYLRRMQIGEAGALKSLPGVNTPGKVIGRYGEAIFSVEAARTKDAAPTALLHRSLLKNDGAFIQESIDLGVWFYDALEVGSHAFILMGPSDYCAADPETRLLAIDLAASKLAFVEATRIPGNWSFDLDQSELAQHVVRLRGGFSYAGIVELDVSMPEHAQIQRYTQE